MAEPTSATLAAATAITTGTLTLAGSIYGIPADAMLAAVVGAGIAMANEPRQETTRASMTHGIVVFSSSLALAIFIGPLAGIAANQSLHKLFGIDLPDGPLRAATSLLVAIGLQRRLPKLLDRLITRDDKQS
jgi:hypothetical protein